MPTEIAGVVLAAVAPARQQQQQQREHEGGNDPARRHRLEPAQEIGAHRHADERAEHDDRGGLAVGLASRRSGISGRAATKSMTSSSAATSRGAAMLLASGMKISAEPKPEKPRAVPETKAIGADGSPIG